jgi:nucleotidyltransferase substrate binding protein (TIGR01987 family)
MNQVSDQHLISIKPTKAALDQLEAALSILSPSDLERDGTIQRFEYCYEIIWKLSQRILKDNEIIAETPRMVFKELGRLGWINNVEDWIEFQKIRNQTSHEYGEKLAQKSYQLAKVFLPLAKELFVILKTKVNE